MPEHIGPRLRDLRKRRGLSQQVLARESGVSLSTIRKLEQGEQNSPRMETVHRLAVALRVTTTHLFTRPVEPPTPAAEPWRALQQAIEAPPVQPADEPDVDATAAVLSAVREAYFDNRLADLTDMLAPLLRDVDALDEAKPEVQALHAHLLNLAGSVLTQVHAYDSAETALRRALDVAPDRLRSASVVTTWVWLLMRQGRLAEAREMAARWADDLEPRVSRATAEDLAAWGWVLTQFSAASLRDARHGEAKDAMRLARGAATLIGRELPRGRSRLATWGPVTVAYKTAERGIMLDRPDVVLETAARLEATSPAESTEHHRHRLDVANAHTMMRQYPEAAEVLYGVWERAPEWLAQQRYAQDIVDQVVTGRRTLTPEMRLLADATGLPL
ncbi:helix-turn-helix domain-containing protein [Streptomyces sp. NPDC050560]|uniref:helix-turn-helix domain-containing protein n=1 Tax=Streptomyces sp. NPDC050560 TaxID=3365630 RepID=UPI003795B179